MKKVLVASLASLMVSGGMFGAQGKSENLSASAIVEKAKPRIVGLHEDLDELKENAQSIIYEVDKFIAMSQQIYNKVDKEGSIKYEKIMNMDEKKFAEIRKKLKTLTVTIAGLGTMLDDELEELE